MVDFSSNWCLGIIWVDPERSLEPRHYTYMLKCYDYTQFGYCIQIVIILICQPPGTTLNIVPIDSLYQMLTKQNAILLPKMFHKNNQEKIYLYYSQNIYWW